MRFLKTSVLFLITAISLLHAYTEEEFDALIEEGNKIVVSAKRIVLKEFPEAFNPSIIEFGDGFLLTFRYAPDIYGMPSVSYIGVVLLNDALEPVSVPQLLSTRLKKSKTPSQSEDARVFAYRDRLFLLYNDNLEIVYPRYWQRRDMYVSELFYEEGQFVLSSPLKLTYEEKRHVLWQKNWVPFIHDNTLLLSYMFNPHEVIYPNFINGSCYHFYETSARFDWPLGAIRGGTPALLVDGQYLSFFHSGVVLSTPASWDWDIWHYFMGAFTFSSKPPFEVTKMSARPIVADEFYVTSGREKRVIFPGGFVVSGSKIILAYGKDDCEIWIAALDKEALMNSLVPVQRER